MASLAKPVRMSEEDYFRLLEGSEHKYEYWDGFAVAMAGAQPDDVRIETNLVGELFGKLRGTDFVPLVSNQAVKLAGIRGRPVNCGFAGFHSCAPGSKWCAS